MKTVVALWILMGALACGGGGGSGNSPDSGGGTPDTGGGSGSNVDGGTNPSKPLCGNSELDPSEICDDGNVANGDGCTFDCTLETGYRCPTPGQACTKLAVCGNAKVDEGEGCDDRNTTGGDGCSADCQIEPGWACTRPGVRCVAADCGDSIVAGFEVCDDGNHDLGDGCSATCAIEEGFKCGAAGAPCTRTTCGDGIREGVEQCDDGNHDLGDGCDTLCHREPSCANGVCVAVCGDNVLQEAQNEQCDDSNLRNGDGCSSDCKLEAGYTCKLEATTEPSFVEVPIVYRDFIGFRGLDGSTVLPNSHRDFENENASELGLVAAMLGADHKPVYAGTPAPDRNNTNPVRTTHGATLFNQWYRDTPGVNMTFAEKLRLGRTGAQTYVFSSESFFPLDKRGFVGPDDKVNTDGTEPDRPESNATGAAKHNFSFTSELRYWFDYAATEVLTFDGDDDVWVFINRKLAVDIGGVHGNQSRTITLSALASSLGLTVGGTYEAVVFQAERHTSKSQYKLTLKGFNTQHSICESKCGDGVTTPDEVCDDGVNMGGYNSCAPGCLDFGARCGDGIKQEDQGEQCDDGEANNTGAYGKCAPNCTIGPRCGDGIVQAGEECEDGNDDPEDGCDQCFLVVGFTGGKSTK